jgi:signal transduction histidine kinase
VAHFVPDLPHGSMKMVVTPDAQARRGISMRGRLMLLTLVGILPLAAMSGFALRALAQQQKEQVEQVGLEVARAMSIAIDAEIMQSIAALEALASSLEVGEARGFGQSVRRIFKSQPNWAALQVHDHTGAALFQEGDGARTNAFEALDQETLAQALGGWLPIIGSLSGDLEDQLTFPVRVPVRRRGQLAYIVSAAVKPDGVATVLERQRLPTDWIVSVFDPAGLRVARSRRHTEAIGQPVSGELRALLGREADEGIGMGRSLEGEQLHFAYSRSDTGFTVAIGMPPSFVDAGAERSLVTYGGGILLSLVLGVLAALLVASGVLRPIGALQEAAQALGRRQPVRAPSTAIDELRQVGESLVRAAAERAQSESEREHLLCREQEARALAETANRAKDEFLAMLGHELRNPLGAIANASRLLDDPRADAATLTQAKSIIARQATHMGRLTDDLLDAARALTGKIVLKREALDLAQATKQGVAAWASDKVRGQRRIEEDLESVWIDADPTRIEQIVGNLLGNALKYSREGGTVQVSVRREGQHALLSVTDDGVGMEPELVRQIFEPFVQGDRELDRRHGGLGIGLTMVRRLVELHEGSVTASSAGTGRGSQFSVRLPAREAPLASGDGHAEPVPAQAPTGRRSILLVEDNDDARESLRRLLELDGHHVTAIGDGASALDCMRAGPPEVALIDIGLPGMDGYEVARRIRSSFGQVPLLVALTGYGLPSDFSRTRAAGFDLHLVKPVARETLDRALRRRA